MIRGDDLLPSTPRQKLLVEAIGAHLPRHGAPADDPGPDKKRLSKRHGAASVEEFRDAGYLPEAVLNYLALLGWSFDDSTELMTRDELVERFTIERVNTSPAVFDHQKLAWMNGVTCATSIQAEYGRRLRAFLAERHSPLADVEGLEDAAPLVQEKIGALGEFEEFAGFLFHPVVYEPRRGSGWPAWPRRERCWTARRPRSRRSTASLTAEAVEAALRGVVETLGLKPRVAFTPPARGDLGPHGLARPVRVDRAARPRGVAGAHPRGGGAPETGSSEG